MPLRFVIAFTGVVASTARGVVGDLTDAERLRFQDAWTKAVLLQIALWSRPYVHDGLWSVYATRRNVIPTCFGR